MSDGFMTGYNLRSWLEAAFEGRAEVVGAGVSCDGDADIDVELEGCRYNITIKPIPAPVILAPQNSAERLPSGDTADPAAGTLSNSTGRFKVVK